MTNPMLELSSAGDRTGVAMLRLNRSNQANVAAIRPCGDSNLRPVSHSCDCSAGNSSSRVAVAREQPGGDPEILREVDIGAERCSGCQSSPARP